MNIHSFLSRSRVNGPGVRSVLWLQGCNRSCPGCFNPEALPATGGESVAVSDVLDWLPQREIEGVTFSGGEPFLQAAPLAMLGEAIRARGLSVLVYTGYLIDEIERSGKEDWIDLLSVADILIDGPYLKDVPPNHRWAGSGNQRVHILGDGIDFDDSDRSKDSSSEEGEIEFSIDNEGLVTVTGFPEGWT
ncbi:anaerobic ribonucleoside-triphosphate reductase activating protein [Alkalispirochaeta americana]|uniref:Anaerobic ribonucleoside-triphosphate reductase activating protein n=2 Tax=Alkalispirochaeta americana TaxID=159291 RepID=A0A1N6X7X2_9SPIO|nr:anaerobic ribonucleoside-triphosphate reductase activating protein [Alkalispirochaeta americana]